MLAVDVLGFFPWMLHFVYQLLVLLLGFMFGRPWTSSRLEMFVSTSSSN